MDKTYGRRRESIADIELELFNLFSQHPEATTIADGDPAIPASALPDVLASFSDLCDGVPLLNAEEEAMLHGLLAENPELQCTPSILLQFIAEKTKSSQVSPPHTPEHDFDDRDRTRSRTNSNDFSNASYYRPPSRPPSRGPMTPGPGAKSPLDSERRQRTTPLTNAAPSAWTGSKRPAPHRRKSDAGSRSDSESGIPNSWDSRSYGRGRIPSNPTSPSASTYDLGYPPPTSPYASTPSRPHSRARSQPQNNFNGSYRDDLGYSSPDDGNNLTLRRPVSRYANRPDRDDSFENQINSLVMPRPEAVDSDSDEEKEIEEGLIYERSITNSTVSMEEHERLEALQKTNQDLARKLAEAEKVLSDKLSQHELDIEDMMQKMEELKVTLSTVQRDEKELRAKDGRSMTQIAALELDIVKLTKTIDASRATYTSLQKQYQEQCMVSERYRDDLRSREDTIRSLREQAQFHDIETHKWSREKETYEDRITALQHDLQAMMDTAAELENQKQENLYLKETIDRMRLEMDRMRNDMTATLNASGSGPSSAANTMSKSLGAELAGKMKWMDDEDDSLDMAEGHSRSMVEEELMSEGTAVEEDDTEGEEEIEIITRRTRKIAKSAKTTEERREFTEVKDYCNSSTQYDPTLFYVNHGVSTEPQPKASFSIQTDPIPEPKPLPPPPPRITIEMEIQTDPVEDEEPSRSPSPVHESLASSSSTILPPTPRPSNKQLEAHDTESPPSYERIAESEREWSATAETLKKWHEGAHLKAEGRGGFEGIPGGVSEEMISEWKALKAELGVDCLVIDKIVEASEKKVSSEPPLAEATRDRKGKRLSAGGRFFNIYNTYVYGSASEAGSADGSSKPPTPTSPLSAILASPLTNQALMFVSASALVILAATPYILPNYYPSVPGGPTYYDRTAWQSFNSLQVGGEGFPLGAVGGGMAGVDGTAAVWNFLGRVGGGAARMARGWPT